MNAPRARISPPWSIPYSQTKPTELLVHVGQCTSENSPCARCSVVVVDSSVLVAAPARYLVAGIGDALSKLAEGEQCSAAGGVNFFGGRQSLLGAQIARKCFDVVLADADEALRAVECKTPNEAFERLLEATILLSGLAFECGGLSVAHSLTRGTSSIPAIHAAGALHGEEVAFGLLVQLALEPGRNKSLLTTLLNFYERIGLPRTLQSLGVPQADVESAALEIAKVTVDRSPHIKHFHRNLGAEELTAAMVSLSRHYSSRN